MPSALSSLINLSNSIIGVSLLTMPYCFQQCGILLSCVVLACSAFVNKFACHLLLKASLLTRRRKLELLASQTLSQNGKLLMEVGLISFLLGGCVALFVVAGDLLPSLLGSGASQESRIYLMVFLALFGALPLALRRNTESLTSFSMVSMLFYVILAFKIFTDSLPALMKGDWFHKVVWWNTDNLTSVLPIFAMALAGQPLVFEVFDLTGVDLHHMRSCDRTVSSAMQTCLTVYMVVGFCGYVASHDRTTQLPGNSLLLLDDSWLSWIFKLGFVMSLIISYPLCLLPCRTSLHSLIYRWGVKPHDAASSLHDYIPENRFKMLTIILLMTTLGAALVIPRIELFLGVTGATIGCAVCIVAPAAIFIGASSKNQTWDRMMAQALTIFGLSLMILCSVSIMYRMNEPATDFDLKVTPILKSLPPKELPVKEEKAAGKIGSSTQNDHDLAVHAVETLKNHTGDVRYEVGPPAKPASAASVTPRFPKIRKIRPPLVVDKPSEKEAVDLNVNDGTQQDKKEIKLLEQIAEVQQEQKKLIEDIQEKLKIEIASHKDTDISNKTAEAVEQIGDRVHAIDDKIKEISKNASQQLEPRMTDDLPAPKEQIKASKVSVSPAIEDTKSTPKQRVEAKTEKPVERLEPPLPGGEAAKVVPTAPKVDTVASKIEIITPKLEAVPPPPVNKT